MLALSAGCATAQKQPPNYSPDGLPETSFTCEDRITGGYYADAEAECQLFHVCVQVSEYEVRPIDHLGFSGKGAASHKSARQASLSPHNSAF